MSIHFLQSLPCYRCVEKCLQVFYNLTHFYAALRMALTRRCVSLRSFIIGSFTQGYAGPPFPHGKRKFLPLWVCMSTYSLKANLVRAMQTA